MKKVLFVATVVKRHINAFHVPFLKMFKEFGWETAVASKNDYENPDDCRIEYCDTFFDLPFKRSPIDPRNIKAYIKLKKILKNNHYDIIHCHTPVGGVLARLAAHKYRKNNTMVLYTAHGFHFYKGAPIKNWMIFYPIEKFLSRYTDKIITINHEDYKLAKSKFHCPVVYVHGVGVNTSKFKQLSFEERMRLRKEFGFTETEKILINVAELSKNKNQQLAVRAMSNIVKVYSDCKLLIAGQGEDLEMLTGLAKELDVEKNIKFLGFTYKIYEYLNIADALVACSFREGLPLNIMEAMLCGKPIIATKNRGHNELVKDGLNGYLVDTDDYEGFADAVIKIFENPSDYSKASVSLVEQFEDKYVYNEMKEIYGL